MDFEAFRDRLQQMIDTGELRDEFSLQDLFRGSWPKLPQGVRTNELGEWFKQHVPGSDSFRNERPFAGIVFSRTKSNNLSVYRLAAR